MNFYAKQRNRVASRDRAEEIAAIAAQPTNFMLKLPTSRTDSNYQQRLQALATKARERKTQRQGTASTAPAPAPAKPDTSVRDAQVRAEIAAKVAETAMKARVVKAACALTGLRADRFGDTPQEQFAAAEKRLFVMGLRAPGMRDEQTLSEEIWRCDIAKIGARFENQKLLNSLVKNEN